jgi:hypothetical protein
MISWVELLSDVQMTCHFISSVPAVIQNHGADLFSVFSEVALIPGQIYYTIFVYSIL